MLQFTSIQCDVGQADQVEAAFGQIAAKFPDKNISILINNAGHAKVNQIRAALMSLIQC